MTMPRWFGLMVGLSLAPALAWSQTPSATSQPDPGVQAKKPAAPSLATRYRLMEHYSVADAVPAGEIGSYQVAFRETIGAHIESGQGAGAARQQTTQAIYTERPAELSALDLRTATAAIRRYDRVRISPEPKTKPSEPPLFDGLTFWYQSRVNELPLAMVLTPGKRLRYPEYYLITRQLFFPRLAQVLPKLPSRSGDAYQVDPAGSEALLGTPILRGGLVSKLESIKDDPADPKRKLALFDITGDVLIQSGQAAVHAQMTYAFTPAPPPPSTSIEAGLGVIDGAGWIIKLSMAEEVVSTVGTDPNDRRRMFLRREIVAERRLPEGNPNLPLPKPVPVPNRQNSWLTYEDSQGRFTIEHPQEFQVAPNQGDAESPDSVDLVHARPEGAEVIALSLLPKAELNGDTLASKLASDWQAKGGEVQKGQAGWLPEADWPGLRVYRFELAVSPPRSSGPDAKRIMIDGYVLQGGRESGLYVESFTPQASAGDFRAQVEDVLHTLQFAGSVTSKPVPAP